MRAHELVARATPRQVAHLRTCVKRANRRLRGGGPEADRAIRGATTTRKQAMLMRTPRESLHRGAVSGVAKHRTVEDGRLDDASSLAARRRGPRDARW